MQCRYNPLSSQVHVIMLLYFQLSCWNVPAVGAPQWCQSQQWECRSIWDHDCRALNRREVRVQDNDTLCTGIIKGSPFHMLTQRRSSADNTGTTRYSIQSNSASPPSPPLPPLPSTPPPSPHSLRMQSRWASPAVVMPESMMASTMRCSSVLHACQCTREHEWQMITTTILWNGNLYAYNYASFSSNTFKVMWDFTNWVGGTMQVCKKWDFGRTH